jgi:Kef-type K+ transport system membrane component KefB
VINKLINPLLVAISLIFFTIGCIFLNFISFNNGISIFAGLGLSLLNFLIFVAFLLATEQKTGNQILILTLSGITFRLILMLIAIFLIIKFLKVDKFGFIFTFFILYTFFLVYEIILIKDKLGKN